MYITSSAISSILQKCSIIFQFIPLSFFAVYVYWQGTPTNARWIMAFEISSALGVLQLLILTLLINKAPLNRFILAANIYLFIGGIACVFQRWEILTLYSMAMESAILGIMFIVGVISTIFSSRGFIGIDNPRVDLIRKYSLILLSCTGVAFFISIVFMGNRILAAVIPILLLAVIRRALLNRLQSA